MDEDDPSNKKNNIKEVGREILKEKLKNLMTDKNRHTRAPESTVSQPTGERQIQNLAEGFINMINNTLAQVNSNLARSIEKKVEQSIDKRPPSLERRSPRKITVPQLEAFRPPPVFNMNLVQQGRGVPMVPSPSFE
jgi:hypothetical protein